jgi:hypothetical protein
MPAQAFWPAHLTCSPLAAYSPFHISSHLAADHLETVRARVGSGIHGTDVSVTTLLQSQKGETE